MNNKKYIIILLALLLLTLLSIKQVYAENPSANAGNDIPSNPDGEGGSGPPTAGTVCGICNTSGRWDIRSEIGTDVYDTDGIFIGSGIEGINRRMTAGRFAGIDAYEKYTKKITVNVESVCVTTVLTCSRVVATMEQVCIPISITFSLKEGVKIKKRCFWTKTGEHPESKTVTSGQCGDEWPNVEVNSWTSPDPGSLDACLRKSEPKNIQFDEIAPSFTATYYNSNDINEPTAGQNNGGTYTVINEPQIEKKIIGPYFNKTGSNTGTVTKSLEYKIKYNLINSCVNVKTGLITIRKESCNGDEIAAHVLSPNGNDNVGKYFIPLNTKSNDKFKFELNPNSSSAALREADLCLDFIRKYSFWRNFIRDKNGKDFFGVSESEAKAKIKSDKYCKYGIVVSFYVDQEFYNENASNKLEGYGFYYRPIDVSNPFPNGLGNSTYWGQKDETNKILYSVENNSVTIDNKTYDLDDSFKTVTYTANINNPNAIREYNKRADSEGRSYLYMSWDNMNVDGSSGFINDGYVTRNDGKQSYYKLGCGPSNNTWKECEGK